MRRSIKPIATLCATVLMLLGLGDRAHAQTRQPDVHLTGDPSAGAAVASDDIAATQAAWDVLRRGGSAADAAIAAAFVMTVAMPDSASIAGAGTALRYDAKGRHISAYVAREVSAASVDPAWLLREDGVEPYPLNGGRSVGAPSFLAMAEMLHDEAGVLDWSLLVSDAVRIARAGTPLTAEAAANLARIYLLAYSAANRFLGGSGADAPKAGAIIRNPELADVLEAIGRDGPSVLAGGIVGQSIVRAIAETERQPADMPLDALAAATAVRSAPDCVPLPYAALCAPPAPTLGPTTLETVAVFAAAAPRAPSAFEWAHIMAQSHRMAMVNANQYLGDPMRFADYMPALLTPARVARRARRIAANRNPGLAGASRLADAPSGLVPAPFRDHRPPSASVVVVDRHGDAVALSMTLTKPFGSGIAARGVLLNAANAAFDAPVGKPGYVRANQLAPNKRPRLELAPVMALDQDRRLLLAAAAGGGDNAPAFIAKAVIAALAFGKSAEAAVGAPNIASAARRTDLETKTAAERLEKPLVDIGHSVRLRRLASGLVLIVRLPDGFAAAADPRNHGAAQATPRVDGVALDSVGRGS